MGSFPEIYKNPPYLESILTGFHCIHLFVYSFIYLVFIFLFLYSSILFIIISKLQPPTPSSSSLTSSSLTSSSLDDAEIIAITLGVVLFLALIGAALYFLYKQDHVCKSR